MIWWIIGIALFILCAVVLVMLNRGADVKKRGDYLSMVEDDEQEKAMSKLRRDSKA